MVKCDLNGLNMVKWVTDTTKDKHNKSQMISFKCLYCLAVRLNRKLMETYSSPENLTFMSFSYCALICQHFQPNVIGL